MSVGPEHALQITAIRFMREQVDCSPPPVIMAYDRSKAQSPRQHMWERRRGIVPGTPDCQLCVTGPRSAFIEFKVKPNKVSPQQAELHARLRALGFVVIVAYTVTELCWELTDAGFRMRKTAEWAASDADARLDAGRLKRKAAAPARPRRARPPATGEELAAESRRRLAEMLGGG